VGFDHCGHAFGDEAMSEDIEKAIAALLAKVHHAPYDHIFSDHVHIDDFANTVERLHSAMEKLGEQRDGWRDKCGGDAMHWREEVSDQQDAAVIEILNGDAR